MPTRISDEVRLKPRILLLRGHLGECASVIVDIIKGFGSKLL